MPNFTNTRSGPAHLCFDADMFSAFEPRLFDPGWLTREDLIEGQALGRGSAYFVRYDGRDMVLRHYFRGGLAAKVLKARYLRWPGAAGRAMAELRLLDWMAAQGLPVPRPLAARQITRGLWYEADLITQRIPGAVPLDERAAAAPLAERTWRDIGAAIAAMHSAGVDHADLNCRNIMLDQSNKVWLIDFDKSARRKSGPWEQRNLDRLQRSLRKVRTKNATFCWTPRDWDALVQGYGQARR